MANWHQQALASVLCCLFASDMTVAQSLPADRAENAAPVRARAGLLKPGPGGSVTLGAVEAAVLADAARVWQLGPGEPMTLSVEELDWADGSLGCARPGMAYTQALVPGWRLVVRHQQREAVYHASRGGQWLLCPGARATPAPPGAVTR